MSHHTQNVIALVLSASAIAVILVNVVLVERRRRRRQDDERFARIVNGLHGRVFGPEDDA